MTNAPSVINLYDDLDFVFDDHHETAGMSQFRTMDFMACLDIAMLWNFYRRDCVVRVLNTGLWRQHLEKVVLLCLIVATISALAQMAPAARRHD